MQARNVWSLVAVLLAAVPARAAQPASAAPAPGAKPAAAPRWLHKASNGTLVLKSATKGASVTVDGLAAGTTPIKPLSLPPGAHEVKLVKDGFAAATRRVQIRAAQPTQLSLELKAAPQVGPLPLALPGAAVAQPPDASESLVALIATPVAPIAETPPPPLLTAELPKPAEVHKPAPTAAVAVAPAASARPLTRQWWFWGGAAAVAVAVVAGVTYALPALYVERRDPAAACGGACGVIVNK